MNELIKVYSHPRSGTHLLMATLAQNFYEGRDVSSPPGGIFGHWNDRQPGKGKPYGKLMGAHFHYSKKKHPGKSIYIYRDGRPVALSVWRSPHFINKTWQGISFSDFIRKRLDFHGSVGARTRLPRMNIFTHWRKHVESWHPGGHSLDEIYYIRFEELVLEPLRIIKELQDHFSFELIPDEPTPVEGLVGLNPNSGKITGWKEHFSQADEDHFFENVSRDFRGVYDPPG